MGYMLYNEEILNRENVVDIEDRGYQFGDGVYEVIGVYNGRPMMMEEHMGRLVRSAKEIQLKLPYEIRDIKSKLKELVVRNDLEEGIIYMQISRGVADRWHQFPNEDVPPVIVAYTRAEERMTAIEDQGATAILAEDIRWLRCDIKTLNLLPNVLAKQKAIENQAIEAILYRGETVTEASSSNVFIVKSGELFTHPVSHYILNGITRGKVLQLCKDLNIKVHEETFTVRDLLAADEVFITATKSDIIPILKVDDHVIGNEIPGMVTKRILEKFRAFINELKNTKR